MHQEYTLEKSQEELEGKQNTTILKAQCKHEGQIKQQGI